jgi:hypothetical protein
MIDTTCPHNPSTTEGICHPEYGRLCDTCAAMLEVGNSE